MTDEELLGRIGRGEQNAWNDLVDRYAQLVFANARAVGADATLAHDVSQAVWMKLLNKLDTIREPSKLRGWLAIVARNTAREELRRIKPTRPLDDLLVITADQADSPEAQTIRGHHVHSIRSGLGRLSVRCRELLTLLYNAEMSYEDITATIDMPIGSIGPTRQRCLKQLRIFLEDDQTI